jgi:putative colanic acid biosynthesis acetyltransferase WcaF
MLDPASPPRERHAASFSLANKAFRVGWSIGWLILARFTPPPLHGWRRLVLRAFGAKIGAGVRVYGSCRIWNPRNLDMGDGAVMGRNVNCYNQGHITIGRDVVISQDTTLCASTHDVEDRSFPLLLRPITIEDDAWIAAEAFVGPGVTIGEGAVLGARGVAMRALEPWTYYSGNPAQPLKARPRFAAR